MDNKTKVKVAVVIAIVVLAVIFILMVVFVKGNRTQVNQNIPRKGTDSYVEPSTNTSVDIGNEDENVSSGEPITSDGIVSIGMKGTDLVAINSNLESTVIKKIGSKYSSFCYGDNKIYTVLDNGEENDSINEIDLLKGDYPEKTILTTTGDYGAIKNVEYYAGKLYFVSERMELVEYSIDENVMKPLANENEVSNFTIDKANNRIYVSYRPNGTNPGVYVLDLTANTFTQIITLNDLPGQLILHGNSLIIDVKEYQRLYVYHIEQNTVLELGADNLLEEAKNQITFYEDVLLYTNGTTIDIKNANGDSYQDGWYTVEDGSIASIAMLDATKLQIARFDGTGKVSQSSVVDLTTGTITQMPDIVYSDVVTIK